MRKGRKEGRKEGREGGREGRRKEEKEERNKYLYLSFEVLSTSVLVANYNSP